MLIPGKVNLFLKVGAVRPQDGRHELSTLFLPLERLCDEVSVCPGRSGGGLSLQCSGRGIAGVAASEDNIAWKAASAFCRYFGVSPDWEVTVRKNIPVSGGLGGGSADAAAVLTELSRQCSVPIQPQALAELALQLGADVPFFLEPHAAHAEGAGEKLRKVRVTARFGIIVVYPGIPSPVAWAYRHCRSTIPLPGAVPEKKMANLEGLAALVDNDLAPALLRKAPVYGMILEAMKRYGCAAATVSGSGSSCFGVCAAGEAPVICARLKQNFADMPALEVFWASEN